VPKMLILNNLFVLLRINNFKEVYNE